jgi:hypothetical protein
MRATPSMLFTLPLIASVTLSTIHRATHELQLRLSCLRHHNTHSSDTSRFRGNHLVFLVDNNTYLVAIPTCLVVRPTCQVANLTYLHTLLSAKKSYPTVTKDSKRSKVLLEYY